MDNKLRPEKTVNLLIVDESPNDAEEYANTLRNTGIAVHSKRVEREDKLIEALEQDEIDMILYTSGTANITPTHAMTICKSRLSDTPLIVIYPDDQDPEPLLEAMREGARDVVSKGDMDHLQIVVSRELSDLQTRKELAQIKKRLDESEQRCNILVESSRDAIAYVHEGMYVHANKAYLDMFGYVEMDDIEGLPMLDMIAPKELKKFKEFLRSLDDDNNPTTLETSCQSSDEKIFKALLEFSPASVDGEPCTQIIIRDQSLDNELEEKIQLLANQDTQTGLYNRRYLMEQLNEITSSKDKNRHDQSLHYILIDGFQKLRSEAGVINSDKLFKQVAFTLSETIDERDLLSRFGDHTFVVLSPKSKLLEAEPFAEMIRTTIEKHNFKLEDQVYNLTCSIGISYLTSENRSSQEIINQAYNACEAAREEGGNLFLSYNEEEMQQHYGDEVPESEIPESTVVEKPKTKRDHSKIDQLIINALENDKFRVVYQPIVSLQGDTREHYAVLTRIINEGNDDIFPADFIDRANQLNLMSKIDRWVIKHAISELAHHRSQGHKTKFFISISEAGIQDESLLLWICDCLRELNAKGAWIIFQFHEEDIRAHTQDAKKLIEGLKKIRCQIAVDRFGLKPKNELMLKHMPIDYVKLDPSLTNGLCQSENKQDQLGDINRSVMNFNIKTIAMGVEDANSLAVLWTVGVNYIQGYFMQKPSETITYDSNSL
jgi:diguanylate cyclase (GGDEF)-like protein/PAS domain S-box-containing protein